MYGGARFLERREFVLCMTFSEERPFSIENPTLDLIYE